MDFFFLILHFKQNTLQYLVWKRVLFRFQLKEFKSTFILKRNISFLLFWIEFDKCTFSNFYSSITLVCVCIPVKTTFHTNSHIRFSHIEIHRTMCRTHFNRANDTNFSFSIWRISRCQSYSQTYPFKTDSYLYIYLHILLY